MKSNYLVASFWKGCLGKVLWKSSFEFKQFFQEAAQRETKLSKWTKLVFFEILYGGNFMWTMAKTIITLSSSTVKRLE